VDSEFTWDAIDENATRAFGAALAAVLPETAVVGLIGPLGAGKTRIVQAVAEAVDISRESVTSPTFVLVHEYLGRTPIFHFDVYRIRDEDEFLNLGPEEYFTRPGWTFIEWADRVTNCLPRDRLEIFVEILDANGRRFSIKARGKVLSATIEALQNRLTTLH
jgi:tRNA threonylcarbamoyladenosine biosynthesis protein TsaE